MLFAGVRLDSNKEDERSDYRIKLDADTDLDIPDDCLTIAAYCATLGHKVNHSWTPNAEWTLFQHPRFGLIRAVASTRDIAEGEEVVVNYNMGLARSPEWYRLLWVRHLKEDKGWSKADIGRYVERNKDLPMHLSLIHI